MMPGISPAMGLEAIASSAAPYSGGSLDTQTVYSGADGTVINFNRRRGFILSTLGACSSGYSAIYGSAQIKELACEESDSGTFGLIFTVAGVVSNSGWTSINVGGNSVFQRASATFSTAGSNSSWSWPNTTNLFGAAGTPHTVGFD